jgi:hypothetical protein
LITSATRVLAVDYNPGVSPGYYVNFDDSSRIEVTAVSGKTITYYNRDHILCVYDLETGMTNGTQYYISHIIAANLYEGDAIPPASQTLKVEKTETRTFLGQSRSVNIVNSTTMFGNYMYRVYDRATGMMLESQTEGHTVTAIQTNIFTAATPSSTPTLTPEATPTPTPTSQPTATPMTTPPLTPTLAVTAAPTHTSSAASTPTPMSSLTESPSSSPTYSQSPAIQPTVSSTSTPSPTASPSLEAASLNLSAEYLAAIAVAVAVVIVCVAAVILKRRR